VSVAGRDRKIAQEMRDRILAANGARVRRIILFGSRGRGRPTPDSDFDILVVEADPVSKREEIVRLRSALTGLSVPVDVLVMGEEEFQETRAVIGGIARPANKYGIVLYETP
jgi:predicted nucleotidyltransferase